MKSIFAEAISMSAEAGMKYTDMVKKYFEENPGTKVNDPAAQKAIKEKWDAYKKSEAIQVGIVLEALKLNQSKIDELPPEAQKKLQNGQVPMLTKAGGDLKDFGGEKAALVYRIWVHNPEGGDDGAYEYPTLFEAEAGYSQYEDKGAEDVIIAVVWDDKLKDFREVVAKKMKKKSSLESEAKGKIKIGDTISFKGDEYKVTKMGSAGVFFHAIIKNKDGEWGEKEYPFYEGANFKLIQKAELEVEAVKKGTKYTYHGPEASPAEEYDDFKDGEIVTVIGKVTNNEIMEISQGETNDATGMYWIESEDKKKTGLADDGDLEPIKKKKSELDVEAGEYNIGIGDEVTVFGEEDPIGTAVAVGTAQEMVDQSHDSTGAAAEFIETSGYDQLNSKEEAAKKPAVAVELFKGDEGTVVWIIGEGGAYKKGKLEKKAVDDEEARENTREWYGKLHGKALVIMKDHGTFEKAGDMLYFGRGGIVSEFIKDSSSYVAMEHVPGDSEEWEKVGLKLDEEKYEEQDREKFTGEDQWQIYFILQQLESGNYKFTENHDKNLKWIKSFVDRIEGDDDDDVESSLKKEAKDLSEIYNEAFVKRVKELEKEGKTTHSAIVKVLDELYPDLLRQMMKQKTLEKTIDQIKEKLSNPKASLELKAEDYSKLKTAPVGFMAVDQALVNKMWEELVGDKPGEYAALDKAPVPFAALSNGLIQELFNQIKMKFKAKDLGIVEDPDEKGKPDPTDLPAKSKLNKDSILFPEEVSEKMKIKLPEGFFYTTEEGTGGQLSYSETAEIIRVHDDGTIDIKILYNGDIVKGLDPKKLKASLKKKAEWGVGDEIETPDGKGTIVKVKPWGVGDKKYDIELENGEVHEYEPHYDNLKKISILKRIEAKTVILKGTDIEGKVIDENDKQVKIQYLNPVTKKLEETWFDKDAVAEAKEEDEAISMDEGEEDLELGGADPKMLLEWYSEYMVRYKDGAKAIANMMIDKSLTKEQVSEIITQEGIDSEDVELELATANATRSRLMDNPIMKGYKESIENENVSKLDDEILKEHGLEILLAFRSRLVKAMGSVKVDLNLNEEQVKIVETLYDKHEHEVEGDNEEKHYGKLIMKNIDFGSDTKVDLYFDEADQTITEIKTLADGTVVPFTYDSEDFNADDYGLADGEFEKKIEDLKK